MVHFFDTEIAEIYGLKEAILLKHLDYWIAKNEANKTHFHDGTYWTYNSVRAFEELFPYMTAKSIRSALDKLKSYGLIMTNKFNQSSYDRTTWYALTPLALSLCRKGQSDFPSLRNRFDEKGEPIPDNINTNNNTDNIIKKSVKKVFDFYGELQALGVEKEVAEAWAVVRKTKRAVNTELSFKRLKEELNKASVDITANDAIRFCVEKSWSYFKHEWYINANSKNNGTGKINKGCDRLHVGRVDYSALPDDDFGF